MIKKISLAMLCLFSLGSITSCNKKCEFDLNSVFVTIKESYQNNFVEKKITVEDFNWENVENLNYGEWSNQLNIGYMTVILKTGGVKYVEDAIEHFISLEFVQSAEKNTIYHIQRSEVIYETFR